MEKWARNCNPPATASVQAQDASDGSGAKLLVLRRLQYFCNVALK
jgi:hypothetical protein